LERRRGSLVGARGAGLARASPAIFLTECWAFEPNRHGAFDNGDGTFTVLMNDEISGNGIVREHGFRGAFVSTWIIERAGC